jgi:hypothetical protein
MSGLPISEYQPPAFDDSKEYKQKKDADKDDEFNLLDFDDFDPNPAMNDNSRDIERHDSEEQDISEEFVKSLDSQSKHSNNLQRGSDDDINSNSGLETSKLAHAGGKDDLESNDVKIVQKPSGYWKYLTVEFYKQFFEVTTEEVILRFRNACFPLYSGSLFDGGKHDLYGPIWIMISLNIAITIFGNIARYIKFETSDESAKYQSDINSLTKSVPMITFYFLLVPLFLSLLVKLGGSGKLSYFYVLSIYGYSFTIFIPATLLYIIPFTSFKWLVLFAAAGISLFFLAKELYNMVKVNLDDYKIKIAAAVM